MTEQLNVPKLRFGEFDGSWQELHLADVAIIQAGFAYKSIEMSRTPKDYQLIKMSNVYQNELRLDRNPSYWDKVSKSDAKFLMKSGDIVLTLTGTVGKTDFGYTAQIPCDGKFLLNQRLVYLRSIDGVSDPKFLLSKLRTSRFYYKFFAEAKGGTGNQANVGMSELAKIKLSYPFYPEQQKIASFLSKVDEKIALLTEKKAKLTEYKKGVMQQLFSGKWEEQNGQLTFIPPTLRFKADDGSEFPDWEEKKLDDICSFTSGKNIKQSEASPDFSTPCVRYGELYHMYGEVITTVVNRTNLEPSELTFSKGNEILLPSAGEDPLDIGAASALTLKDVAIGRTINVLRPKTKDSYCHIYVSYYINNKLKKKISTLARGASISNVYNSDLKGLSILLPSLEEQQVVKSFLFAIEEKINLTNSELEKAKEWKRGLLQQMFV